VFAVNYGLDRITKLLAEASLKGTGTHSFLGGLFLLLYAENDGAFLSLGSAWPMPVKAAVFIVIPLAVCLYGLGCCLVRNINTSYRVIITTIVAGGIGNLQDRIFNSFKVVDFMNFGIGGFRTGILNVGDMSVTFGAIALAIAVTLAERKRETGATPSKVAKTAKGRPGAVPKRKK
jgi:signal peptidase II